MNIRGFLVVALAVVALVVPAAGQGRGTTSPLAWQYGSKIVTSYNVGKLPLHVSVFTEFYFKNRGALTGTLKITLMGSSAFAKTSDKCTATRLKKDAKCRVTIAYKAGSASSDKAVLTGVAGSRTPVSLTLSGSRGPAANSVWWVNRGTYGNDGTVKTIPSGKSSATTLAFDQQYPDSVVVYGTNV